MEQQTGSKLGKEYIKAVYYHPAYLTSIRVHHEKCWLDEAQAGIKIAGRNISNRRYADDTTASGAALGTALNLLSLFHRHGPGMKELGFVILT